MSKYKENDYIYVWFGDSGPIARKVRFKRYTSIPNYCVVASSGSHLYHIRESQIILHAHENGPQTITYNKNQDKWVHNI